MNEGGEWGIERQVAQSSSGVLPALSIRSMAFPRATKEKQCLGLAGGGGSAFRWGVGLLWRWEGWLLALARVWLLCRLVPCVPGCCCSLRLLSQQHLWAGGFSQVSVGRGLSSAL